MVKIVENPMNKWMIWGVNGKHPYFWFNTQMLKLLRQLPPHLTRIRGRTCWWFPGPLAWWLSPLALDIALGSQIGWCSKSSVRTLVLQVLLTSVFLDLSKFRTPRVHQHLWVAIGVACPCVFAGAAAKLWQAMWTGDANYRPSFNWTTLSEVVMKTASFAQACTLFPCLVLLRKTLSEIGMTREFLMQAVPLNCAPFVVVSK